MTPNLRILFSAKIFVLGVLTLSLLTTSSCNHKKKLHSIDPEFAKYIEAYTSGTVSKTSSVTIKLNQDISSGSHSINEEVKESLFSFSPSVSGKTVWTDERTVVFTPAENLKPGQLYDVEFYLSKVARVPADFKTFRFNIQVLEPSFIVKSKGLKTDGNSKEKMIYTGLVETADLEDSALVQKIISVNHKGNKMELEWSNEGDPKRHLFQVKNIIRNNSSSDLEISYDGDPIGAELKGKEIVKVPAVGDFKVMDVVAVNENDNYALVQFSAPISSTQDLTGLITLSPDPYVSYSVEGSEVKVYGEQPLEGYYSVNIATGVENIWGEKLEKKYAANIFFENKKPSVTIIGNGVILPNTGKVVLPFEAVNLKAVDVSIIRIYEKNVPQFLQVNSLDGQSDLRRVARPIVQKTIPLDNDKTLDLTRRNRFSLDIDQLIKTEPGAIYRITIGFRPEYSLYNCTGETGSGEQQEDDEEWYDDYYYDDYYYYGSSWSDEDDAFWQRYNDYYPYGYDWQQRDNPCHPSYYNKEKWQTRNIIASNIGLTVKLGNDKSITILVTDLITANPLPNVQLELLDYQQQVIQTLNSDANGLATIELKRKPFMLVAKRNSERGYLKLDDGSSLTTSSFEVGGEEVQDGIKGFIFGERGVWRPGDSLYLSFILEDKGDVIPDDHPVELNLYTPQGQLYKKSVLTEGLNGYYVFRTATDPSAPTGNWMAKVNVGGASFEKRLKIETIMPNRLKINLDFGTRKVLGILGDDPVTLSSSWLFGAPARNLKAKVDATLSQQTTKFDGYADYLFDDPTATYSSQVTSVFDGKLNEEGKTDFNVLFENTEGAPGFLRANFTIKVFEPGGAFSIDNITMPYSPYASYVGVKVPEGEKPFNYLLTGKTYNIDIVNVDAAGKKTGGNKEVKCELYKVEWKWWWDNSGSGLSNYTSSRYSKLIKSSRVTLSNGKGKWAVSAPEDGWGRYLLVVRDEESGHTTGKIVYFDDAYWQTRSRSEDGNTATMLSFSSDKPRYNVGEKIKLSIPSSENGRLFISVENGRKVLKTYWLKTEPGQTKFEFTAEEGMAPNIYVNVSLIQPHAQTLNDLPIRMYGVIPVMVDDKNTILTPQIAMPDVIRPEQNIKMTISEKDGKEMTYTIAIVDEGLLDLTRFKTPDPHAWFYSKEALGVKTWDLYDQVIGAYGGQLERILTIGGDEDYGGGKQKGANRFKPVVKFMGPFHLKKGQKQNHEFKLPPYFGSVRVMVVAEQNAAYGNAEKTVAVKNPLMMFATLPRVLGPQEEIKIPVTVFATEKSIKTVSVELQNNTMLEMTGPRKQTVKFNEVGEQTVYFDAKVRSGTGVTKVKVMSSSGSEKASNEIEIEVRNPNPSITKVDGKIIDAGNVWDIQAGPIGEPTTSNAVLELSSSPPINLQKRMQYLIQYPHGCIEQITSSVFPQLVLADFMELSENRKKEIQKNVNVGIRKVLNNQTPDGGFSYWPGGRQADDWGSSYAGHFLLEARARGYNVPDESIKSWIRYQRNRSNRWTTSLDVIRYQGDLPQAYRLYTLALAKAPELGAMNRLKEYTYLSKEAAWSLASAYQLAGHTSVASALIKDLEFPASEEPYYWYSYGSSLRNKAIALETLVLMKNKKRAQSLVLSISSSLEKDSWYSTQTTAYCLLAISKFNGSFTSDKKISATVTFNGNTTNVSTASVITQLPLDVTKGTGNLKIKNNGSTMLYVRLITSGQPLPGEDVPAPVNTSRLQMSVKYLTQNGEALDISQLTQGTDFVAKVEVMNPGGFGYYHDMALTQIFPSGWEILNTRIWDESSAYKSSYFEYQDIRDDRVHTYFDLGEKKAATFYFTLNAAYMGKYYLPITVCEAMYDNNISASVSGRWVEVVQ